MGLLLPRANERHYGELVGSRRDASMLDLLEQQSGVASPTMPQSWWRLCAGSAKRSYACEEVRLMYRDCVLLLLLTQAFETCRSPRTSLALLVCRCDKRGLLLAVATAMANQRSAILHGMGTGLVREVKEIVHACCTFPAPFVEGSWDVESLQR